MKTAIPGFREQFEKLIAHPTVSCTDPALDMSNRAFVDELAAWLEDLGFRIEIMPVHDSPEKVNLIAVAGQGEGGLVLSGHSDTVPFDESGWGQDPFRLTEKDNRYYGLGTSDMKSLFPIALDVIRELDISHIKHPLYLLATCDEESNMSGARALVSSGRALGRYALIGEPTGLRPINMHKGILFETIRLVGQSGHSSNPALGRNALEGMNRVINGLVHWRKELQQEHNPLFQVPHPTLNLGSIHGGDSPNRICGECELKIDIRFLPHMELQDLRAKLRQQVLECVDGSGLVVEFDDIFPGVPGLATPVESDIVMTAERLAGEPSGCVAFGTEGAYLNAAGMDTVILGPGDIDVAHQPNEYLALERIEPMKKIIAGMIKQYCM